MQPVRLPRPTFLRIVEDVKHRIRNGEFAPGDAIPGQTALMREYGVSLVTMRKALNMLYAEKVVYPRAGKGIFVAEHKDDPDEKSRGRVGLAFVGSSFYRGMIKPESIMAMQRVLSERALDLVVCGDPQVDLKSRNNGLYALVLVGEVECALLDRLRRENVLALVTGEMLDVYCPDTAAQVGGDLEGCVDMAVGYLKELGHRNLGLALRKGARAWKKTGDYLKEAAARHGLEAPPAIIPVENNDDQNRLAESVKKLQVRPTALLTTGGQMGGQTVRILREGGLRVPEDVSLMAINTVPEEFLPIPDISRVNVDQTAVWEEAGRALIRMIETGQTIYKAIPPRLIIGATSDSLRRQPR